MILISPPTGPQLGAQPVVGSDSGTVYHQQSCGMLLDVTAADAVDLIAAGYTQLTDAGVTSIVPGNGIVVDQETGDVTITGAAPKGAVATGGAAGNITVAGIKLGDTLVQVVNFIGAGVAVTDVTDLTSEFTITADGTINNTGGTSTAGNKLLVNWTTLS